jgi:hypothetical protein
MGRISKGRIATWTLAVVHPATTGAGADSPNRCRRPHWMMAKGQARKMKVFMATYVVRQASSALIFAC